MYNIVCIKTRKNAENLAGSKCYKKYTLPFQSLKNWLVFGRTGSLSASTYLF